jgi:DNA polymerase (family 10)
MPKLQAPEVAGLLKEMGQRTLLRGGNRYRARAYLRAAQGLLALTRPLDVVVARRELRQIPGVGETIAGIIEQLSRTGSHPALESMRSEVPASLVELLQVPGLRPETVGKLFALLDVRSLADLEQAVRADRLAGVKGLGPALQNRIRNGLEIARETGGAMHIHRAEAILQTAMDDLQRSGLEIQEIVAAGDFRRGCELVRDLTLVAKVARTGMRRSVKHGDVAVYFSDANRFGTDLLLLTGSVAHLEELRPLAAGKGFNLAPSGLSRGRRRLPFATEAELYGVLGLPFIAPELREGEGEVKLALAGRLPDLVRDADICGILHAHTDRSDGTVGLEAMAEAVRGRGYAYFGVADHSRSAHYVGGLSVEEIFEQLREIDRLNDRYDGRFRIFKGIESDILPDGALDYPDDVLLEFDFVVASVHSHFRMDRKAQTKRILTAVANPRTTILGHLTGRQLLRRKGYEVDVEAVLAACAASGVAVEINANPWRLDLDWRWHRKALELGCTFAINPDAHSIPEIDLTRWGVRMARKGGVPAARVLNCLDRRRFAAFLDRRRSIRSA